MEFLLLARHLLRQVFTLLFVANFPPFKTSPTTRSWELLSSDKIDVGLVSYI